MAVRDQRKHIGLFGGSFNPAHDGHLYVSEQALQALQLDAIWWLVSPQNPLKDANDIAPFAERLLHAQKHTQHYDAIEVLDIEEKKGLTCSIDTITQLKASYPDHQFIWIIGADNLTHFHQWHRYARIFDALPIVVVHRGNEQDKAAALNSPAALKYAAYKHQNCTTLISSPCPAWCFLDVTPHPESASRIRQSLRMS